MRVRCLHALSLFGLFVLATTALAQDTPKARAPVQQPALKQAPAPQSRSAQGDCVREANRRGFAVLDTGNFQQFRDGWSIDLRVRNQRGQVTSGSCFVETRSGDVSLYGFGWGYDDSGDERMSFNCASVDMKYRECQLPVKGRAVLVKRISDARCVEGQSWGQRGDRVWVNHGCRARFEVTRPGGGSYFDCRSHGGRYRECSIGQGHSARLVREYGQGRCRANSTWGVRDGVVWVTNGCAAQFERVRGIAGGSGGWGPARAEQACVDEVRRRGARLLERKPVTSIAGGYRMQLRVLTAKGQNRWVACTYSSQSQQVRLDAMTGT